MRPETFKTETKTRKNGLNTKSQDLSLQIIWKNCRIKAVVKFVDLQSCYLFMVRQFSWLPLCLTCMIQQFTSN